MRDTDGGGSTGGAATGDGVGVLVVRVWSEGEAGERAVRIRLTGRADVTVPAQTSRATESLEDAVCFVRAWLQQFEP